MLLYMNQNPIYVGMYMCMHMHRTFFGFRMYIHRNSFLRKIIFHFLFILHSPEIGWMVGKLVGLFVGWFVSWLAAGLLY